MCAILWVECGWVEFLFFVWSISSSLWWKGEQSNCTPKICAASVSGRRVRLLQRQAYLEHLPSIGNTRRMRRVTWLNVFICAQRGKVRGEGIPRVDVLRLAGLHDGSVVVWYGGFFIEFFGHDSGNRCAYRANRTAHKVCLRLYTRTMEWV